MLARFFDDWRSYGLKTAYWNLRFDIGWAIGGFTSAKRTRRPT